jgi:hypothetical protein
VGCGYQENGHALAHNRVPKWIFISFTKLGAKERHKKPCGLHSGNVSFVHFFNSFLSYLIMSHNMFCEVCDRQVNFNNAINFFSEHEAPHKRARSDIPGPWYPEPGLRISMVLRLWKMYLIDIFFIFIFIFWISKCTFIFFFFFNTFSCGIHRSAVNGKELCQWTAHRHERRLKCMVFLFPCFFILASRPKN